MTRRHEWVLGQVDLVEPEVRPNSGYWFATLADGFDLGAAEAQRVVRPSLLLDGDDVSVPHWGNRVVQFSVEICGYTPADIADGERALVQELGRPNALSWTPPGSGPSSIFRVWTSSTRKVPGDDLQFVRNGVMSLLYEVTLDCAPWAYSANVVTETFTPGAGTVTTIDGCSALTNWPDSFVSLATYLTESCVAVPLAAPPEFVIGVPRGEGYARVATVSYTGSVGSATYVYLDVAWSATAFRVDLSGNPPLATVQLTNGFRRHLWARPTGPVQFNFWNATNAQTAYIDEFGSSSTLPSSSLFALSMKGSVRCHAQLQIAHPTSNQNLGEVFVYADPTMLNNGWEPGDSDTWANAPDDSYWVYLQPDASYAAGDVFALTISGQEARTRVPAAGTSSSPWFPIGPFHLGSKRDRRLGAITGLVDSISSGSGVLKKNGANAAAHARLIREDEDACLFHAIALTGSSPTNRYLFIDPPTLDQMQPGVYSGNTATGSDAVSWIDPDTQLPGWAWPILVPPVTALWVSSSATTTPVVTVTHRPAYHTYAAD